MVIPELAHLPVDPLYGEGAYRRRLKFVAVPGAMVAHVDDSFHSYWLLIEHDQAEITSIDAGFLRAPTNMCGGSIVGLARLQGAGLTAPDRDYMALLPQTSNCTHLTDLAIWTLAQLGSSSTWDITVPDPRAGRAWVTIHCDGDLIHRWQVAGFEMRAPVALAGRPLMRGFMKWARDTFTGRALLAATMLQRGLFVARGRQHIVDRGKPPALSNASGMEGMCWSYSGDRWATGLGTLDFVRDFSDTVQPEQLPDHIRERLKESGS